MKSQGDKRYKALDHPLRRRIIELLSEEPRTYTLLLNKLEIESGHLAYHLRNLDELLGRDEQGKYYLNESGVKAHEFLTGETRPEKTTSSLERTVFLSIIILIVVIAGAILLMPPNLASERRIEEQKTKTYALSLQALDIVYEVFEDWEIPREHWTDLLLKIVEMKSNLEDLYELSADEQYRVYAERLSYFEDELSNVIIVGDPGYMTLTVEKRFLIRELHSLLLEIEESL
jgi:DNA-binding transcriptional ArsR family regulator